MGFAATSQPIAPPETRTQAGKSCLEAGEAHPADDGLSGWAEDVGFVEDIEHSPLVQRLQVAPAGERSRCWAGGQGQGHGMGDGGGTGPLPVHHQCPQQHGEGQQAAQHQRAHVAHCREKARSWALCLRELGFVPEGLQTFPWEHHTGIGAGAVRMDPRAVHLASVSLPIPFAIRGETFLSPRKAGG